VVELVAKRRQQTAWQFALLLMMAHIWVAGRLADWRVTPAVFAVAIAALLLVCGVAVSKLILSRRRGEKALSPVWHWIGYTALGLFSSLFVLTVCREAGILVAALVGYDGRELQVTSALAVVLAAVSMTVIGFISAMKTAEVSAVDVRIKGLPEALDGFRIAHLSDLHIGAFVRRDYVQRIVDRTNALQADLIVLTGDIVDGAVEHIRDQAQPLAALRARHGSLMVLGNHELMSGVDAWLAAFQQLGMPVLMNEHVVVEHNGGRLVVAGVTDYSAGRFRKELASDPKSALAGAPAHAGARILLAHQPRSVVQAHGLGLDLQLSGHTHAGQMWPWQWFVRIQQPFVKGLGRVGDMQIYVSSGAGFWGPPKRFLAPSEIACIQLRRA